MIPKHVYQTWKTKDLPEEIQEVRANLQELNPDYTFHLFDDAEMDSWMKANMTEEICAAYFTLAVGAAKADLWRYCIVYTQGGIYLDIDSDIVRPIDSFVGADDQAVLSREKNPGCFLQWCMAFVPEHPILKRTIEIVVKNIQGKVSSNVAELTGPHAFSKGVQEIMGPLYGTDAVIYYEADDTLNRILNTSTAIRCKFIGFDFECYARWKSLAAETLYTKDTPHWLEVDEIFV